MTTTITITTTAATGAEALSRTVAAATRIAVEHGLRVDYYPSRTVAAATAQLHLPDDHPLLALTGGTDEVAG